MGDEDMRYDLMYAARGGIEMCLMTIQEEKNKIRRHERFNLCSVCLSLQSYPHRRFGL
jgi:hypothetical protein